MSKNDKAVAIGMEVARRVFDLRSRGRRNSEIHVNETELAAMIAIGAELGMGGKLAETDKKKTT